MATDQDYSYYDCSNMIIIIIIILYYKPILQLNYSWITKVEYTRVSKL